MSAILKSFGLVEHAGDYVFGVRHEPLDAFPREPCRAADDETGPDDDAGHAPLEVHQLFDLRFHLGNRRGEWRDVGDFGFDGPGAKIDIIERPSEVPMTLVADGKTALDYTDLAADVRDGDQHIDR